MVSGLNSSDISHFSACCRIICLNNFSTCIVQECILLKIRVLLAACVESGCKESK